MEKYFTGEALYGDDFSEEQIKIWFDQEAEAFADLYGNRIKQSGGYGFHDLNILYGFKYLNKDQEFNNVLGFGASWGYEFMPIIDKVKNLTIVEASSQTVSAKLGEVIPTYKTPSITGKLEFQNNSFDLITCFDTLHHIPNVTFVLNELFRVLAPGGVMLLREPIHSMGDWRTKRLGITTNERGVPIDYLENIIKNAGIQISKKHYYNCMRSYLGRVFKGMSFLNTNTYLCFDKYLSKLFSFNVHYHETNKLQRIAPSSVFYVLKKPE